MGSRGHLGGRWRSMHAHVLESDTQIRSESLRYSTDLPGQALAYKMGSREFVQLRAGAERAVGSRFNLPAYHDTQIGSGNLPMTVVRAQVAAWVQGQAESRYGARPRGSSSMTRPDSVLR